MGALKGQMNDFCTLLVSLNIANVRNRTSNNTGNLQDVASGLPSGGISRTYSLTERQQMFDDTKFASQVISTTGYILFYILLVLFCLFARKVRGMRTFSRSRGHFVFILTGALFSIVTIFSVDNLVLEWVSRIIIFCSAAGPFLIYGSLKYFMQPNKQTYRITQTPELNDSKTETHNSSNPVILSPSTSTTESEQLISSVHEEDTEVESARKRITDSSKIQGEAPLYGDAKLEHVIGFVTFLLVAMETFIIFALVKESVSTNPILESTGRILDVFQKVITAIVYAYVCKKIVHPNFKVEALMYLKIFSLINLTFWVDTLANIDTSLMFTLATSVYGPAFKIAETIYEALLTDYRLLLAFLLLEHASHLEHNCPLNKENKCVGMPSGKVAVPVLYRSLEEEQARYIGYIIGFVLIIVQMIWGLQYVSQLGLAPVVHSLALVVHVSFILLSSAFLKANNHLKHAEVSSIDVMAACMGAIGVCYWLFKSFLVFYWATTMEGEPRDYFIWTATKSLTRGTCSVFQIILLLKINEKALGTNVDRRNHMIVPALMIGMLAIFIGSAADQYLGKVDTKVRCEIKSWSLRVLMLTAPPIHLGFCIHLFIKFLIISRNMGKTWVLVDRARRSGPLLESLITKNQSKNYSTVDS